MGLVRTSRPVPVDECEWTFPKPGRRSDRDGLLATGADLRPSTLVHAYRHGVFPWPHDDAPLPWFSPNPRGILPLDHLQVSKSLRQRLRRCGWTTTMDRAFDEVILACSQRPDGSSTWIEPAMIAAYGELHRLGWAHSLEVWDGARLVGGLYGMLLGGVFTGESMFHHETDASKVAIVDLANRLLEAKGAFVDVQLVTDHLASLGAIPIGRPLFLELLAECRDDEVQLLTNEFDVARLAIPPVSAAPHRVEQGSR